MQEEAKKEARQEVRILSYNIHAWSDIEGIDNFDRLCDVIKSTNADIVTLYEVLCICCCKNIQPNFFQLW